MALAAAMVALAVWWLRTPPTLLQIVRHTIEAAESGDGSGVLRFVDPNEVAALGFTPKKMDGLLAELNRPLAQREESGEIQFTANEAAKTLLASKTTKLTTGKRIELEVMAVVTDRGGMIISLTQALFMYAISKRLDPDGEGRKGWRKLEVIANALPEAAKPFEQVGIKGVYIVDSEGKHFLPWSELKRLMAAKAEFGKNREIEAGR